MHGIERLLQKRSSHCRRSRDHTSACAAILLVVAALLSPRLYAGEQEWKQYIKRGVEAQARGDFRSSFEAFQMALDEAKAFGEDDGRLGDSLHLMGVEYHRQGVYSEAERLIRRGLAIIEKARGPEHPSVTNAMSNLAAVHSRQGRYRESESLLLQALAIAERANPFHANVANALNHLAQLYRAQGRYSEAETLYRRALSIREKNSGPAHWSAAALLSNLADLYQQQARFAEAIALSRRALTIIEKTLGPRHPRVVPPLSHLASVYSLAGRHSEAQLLLQRALEVLEGTLGSDHPDFATTLSNLGYVMDRQAQHQAAESLYARALAVHEKAHGVEHPGAIKILNNLGSLYLRTNQYPYAEKHFRRAISISEKVFGPEHPDLATLFSNVASLYRAQNMNAQALEAARAATRLLANRYGSRDEVNARGVMSEQRGRSGTFEKYAALAYAAGEDAAERKLELADEALSAAQLARASDTSEQLARMAARQAAGTDRLADVVRKRQDLVSRWEQVDRSLVAAVSRPPAQRQAALEAQLRERQQTTRSEFEALDAQIEQEFPQYRELTDPRPLKLDTLQRLLGADEALIATLSMGDATLVWVVRSNAAEVRRVAVSRKELSAVVQRLRRQLDLSVGDPNAILSQPFDIGAAHDLYRQLLAPFETQLAGVKHLIVVPDGALQSLPLSVLVTEAPSAPVGSIGDHANVAWLAKQYAITTLPSVGSLRALRAFAKAAPAPDPFSGFGDPLLDGGKDAKRNASVTAFFSRGAVADVNAVRKLARLPESADELRAIATALKAPADQLHLGSAANEARVKTLDLSRFRNLAFATHGLMAGEFKGLAEPALVLTPPEKGSVLDDGLLTASEIAQLKLNADWVILSACNTAAPDGTPGGEGLSGLAKSFFYAGARSLLVSHWAVESSATVALTTRMFEENAKGAPKAEALRRSMLALMLTKDKPHYAHPAFWAPFVVVGEGVR